MRIRPYYDTCIIKLDTYFQVVSKSHTVESSDEYNTDVIDAQPNIAEPDADEDMA